MTRLTTIATIALLLSACSGGGAPDVGDDATSPSSPPSSSPTEAGADGLGGQPGASDSPSAPTGAVELSYEVVAEGFVAPVLALPRPGSDEVWVVEQPGRVVTLAGQDVVADLEDRVAFRGERGLLGLAFSPDHATSGEFVLHYSRAGDGATRIERWAVGADGVAQPADVILEVDQPAGNHNGGMIAFGPDGMLYVGLGDGGAADDRFGNGQRADTLLGTILRIDVGQQPYAIPSDNPFVGGRAASGDPASPEVWAYGLRNPWRFWIDEPSGQLVVADVGQNAVEEVDVLPLGDGGANLGWPIMEGESCFQSSDCDPAGLVLPVAQYTHDDGCSVTGGVVVRTGGPLEGQYLYSDFCTGFLRSVVVDGEGRGTVTDWTEQVGVPGQVLSFGLDGQGRPLVLTADGAIRRLVGA